jgi:hypothetical protein
MHFADKFSAQNALCLAPMLSPATMFAHRNNFAQTTLRKAVLPQNRSNRANRPL